MNEQKNRVRSLFDSALIAVAIAAAVVAVGIVVALFSWVSSLPEQQISPPKSPTRRPAAVAPSTARAQPAARAPTPSEHGAVPTPVSRPVDQAAAVPPTASTWSANSDAAKNRAIGEGLSRLAKDPERLKQLGLDVPP